MLGNQPNTFSMGQCVNSLFVIVVYESVVEITVL